MVIGWDRIRLSMPETLQDGKILTESIQGVGMKTVRNPRIIERFITDSNDKPIDPGTAEMIASTGALRMDPATMEKLERLQDTTT